MVDAALLRERAQNLLALGRADEARSVLGELLASYPHDAATIRMLAEVTLDCGDGEEAVRLAERAVGIEADAHSYAVLGSILRRSGHYAASLEACDAGLQLDPEFGPLHVTMALAFAGPWIDEPAQSVPGEQRRRAAAAACESAAIGLELEPDWDMAFFAAASAELAAGDLVAAARVLDQGIALHPDFYAGHLLMSAIRNRQGMTRLASRHLATAGQLDPSCEEPLARLRSLRGRSRSLLGRRRPTPWWLVSEAREILISDDRFRS